jgi:serine phosphatase RsbU (regulator of sigma subunit)
VAGKKYATLLVAQLGRDGNLRIVNCGHVPAVIARNDGTNQVRDGDLPVGLIPEAVFHAIEQDFPPGSRLCLLTDGISESDNPEGLEFGMEPVEQLLSAADPVEVILAANQAFCRDREAQDDRTLVVLERTA